MNRRGFFAAIAAAVASRWLPSEPYNPYEWNPNTWYITDELLKAEMEDWHVYDGSGPTVVTRVTSFDPSKITFDVEYRTCDA